MKRIFASAGTSVAPLLSNAGIRLPGNGSRTFCRRTSTGPIPVWITRSGLDHPFRSGSPVPVWHHAEQYAGGHRRAGLRKTGRQSRRLATFSAAISMRRAPSRAIYVSGSMTEPGWRNGMIVVSSVIGVSLIWRFWQASNTRHDTPPAQFPSPRFMYSSISVLPSPRLELIRASDSDLCYLK